MHGRITGEGFGTLSCQSSMPPARRHASLIFMLRQRKSIFLN